MSAMTNIKDIADLATQTATSLKALDRVLLERRASVHFTDELVPKATLNALLALASQAPSGYNLQPWRFIVVRDAANRQRLKDVAMNQEKIAEAPVVVIAVGMKNEWRDTLDEIMREGVRRGIGKLEKIEAVKKGALDFLDKQPMETWVTRHTMIAVTTLMLAAEAYGFDTAPMEGFDPEGVKKAFAIPEEGEVVCLLAIGRARQPDKPYPGRLAIPRIVFTESFGQPWSDPNKQPAMQ